MVLEPRLILCMVMLYYYYSSSNFSVSVFCCCWSCWSEAVDTASKSRKQLTSWPSAAAVTRGLSCSGSSLLYFLKRLSCRFCLSEESIFLNYFWLWLSLSSSDSCSATSAILPFVAFKPCVSLVCDTAATALKPCLVLVWCFFSEKSCLQLLSELSMALSSASSSFSWTELTREPFLCLTTYLWRFKGASHELIKLFCCWFLTYCVCCIS